MVDAKDRFGETLKLLERAKEDIYFAQRDRVEMPSCAYWFCDAEQLVNSCEELKEDVWLIQDDFCGDRGSQSGLSI